MAGDHDGHWLQRLAAPERSGGCGVVYVLIQPLEAFVEVIELSTDLFDLVRRDDFVALDLSARRLSYLRRHYKELVQLRAFQVELSLDRLCEFRILRTHHVRQVLSLANLKKLGRVIFGCASAASR